MLTLIVLLIGTPDISRVFGESIKPDLVSVNFIGAQLGFGSYSPQDFGRVLGAPILDSELFWGKNAGLLFGFRPAQVLYSQGSVLIQVDEIGTVRQELFTNTTWELLSFKLGLAFLDEARETWRSKCLFRGLDDSEQFIPRLEVATSVIPISIHSMFYDSPTFFVIQNSICATLSSMFSIKLEHKWRPFYTPSQQFWEANLLRNSITLFLCVNLEIDWLL